MSGPTLDQRSRFPWFLLVVAVPVTLIVLFWIVTREPTPRTPIGQTAVDAVPIDEMPAKPEEEQDLLEWGAGGKRRSTTCSGRATKTRSGVTTRTTGTTIPRSPAWP